MDMRILAAAAAALLSAAGLHARAGIGGGAGGDFSPVGSDTFASAGFRTDTSPWGVSVNAHFSPVFSGFIDEVSVDVDNWFVYGRLAEHADIFVLWGISGGATFPGGGDFLLGTGARFGGGVSMMFFGRSLELAAQAVWNPYFALGREDGSFASRLRPLNFPVSLSARAWF